MTSILESVALGLLDCSGQTLLSTSVITFSFPLRNSCLGHNAPVLVIVFVVLDWLRLWTSSIYSGEDGGHSGL